MIEAFQSVIGKPMHQSWCVDFVQYCVTEVDKKFLVQSVLFKTESALHLWNETPKVARLSIPEPGCIMLWQHFGADGRPLWEGHAGIVRESLSADIVLTVEGNTSPGPGIQREGDGVYMKRRHVKVSEGPMRTLGFLLPWAV